MAERPDLAKHEVFDRFIGLILLVFDKIFEHTLALIICYWAIFNCCKIAKIRAIYLAILSHCSRMSCTKFAIGKEEEGGISRTNLLIIDNSLPLILRSAASPTHSWHEK